jgi:hypothetical protein
MPRQGLRLFHGGPCLDYQIDICQAYGVKVELASYGFLGNASTHQIGIKRPGWVGRYIEQRPTREDMAPFVATAGIEFLRIPGMANAYRSSTT